MNLVIDVLKFKCLKEISKDKLIGRILVRVVLRVHCLSDPSPPLHAKATINAKQKKIEM